MSRKFSQNIVSSGKIIDFHTHPYRHRGEFMGMYGEHFYLEPEQMPGDLAEAGISVSGRSSEAPMCRASTCTPPF